MTKGTVEGEYQKYEPEPASRIRPRKLEPVAERKTGRDNYVTKRKVSGGSRSMERFQHTAKKVDGGADLSPSS